MLRREKKPPQGTHQAEEDDIVIGITLHNNERTNAQDLFVSVNDLNQAGQPVILANQRINVDQTFSIQVQEDGNGNGNVSWTAQSADGSHTNQGNQTVTDGATVEVTSW
jgi:hypothetical protein